ncbi:hypothetical protein CPJCM30710_19750 [Clostridium polyendosporum]|uniref:Uncharacterized protein n=1 Tax=Clostridium polyendosporum TaxID=69208 RepID=A0A919VEM1_9CLOT|nr:hypothetical protein [Clostridium polyendosporum]GIM29309.1 hypothetical protein CPJCM30710_19750 [Clostridium polyendosporum]
MDWVKAIISLFSDKGYKNIGLILEIILLCILFISPSFTFIFLYNNELFSSIKLGWSILLILVFSSLLFMFLFVIRLIGNINLSAEDNISSRETIITNVIITIVMMAIIAVLLFLVYSVKLICSGDESTRFSIISLFVVIILVVLKDTIKLIQNIVVLLGLSKKENNLKKEEKVLQDENNKLKDKLRKLKESKD